MRANLWRLCVLVVLTVSVAASAAAQQAAAPDPIADDLAKAKETYQTAVAKARDEILKAFAAEEKKLLDSRLNVEEKVRRVEQVQAEKKAFEAEGKLPTSATMKIAGGKYQIAIAQAKLKCENAFQTAAEKYGRIDLAKAKTVLKEKTEFFDRDLSTASTIRAATAAPPMATAPFDAAQAKRHQEAWAAHLGVPVEYANSIGMKFRLIPPGQFDMGISAAQIDAEIAAARSHALGYSDTLRRRIQSAGPQHSVVLTRAVYLGAFEVTQAEYQRVMGKNPSHFSPSGGGKDRVAGIDTATHPAEMVAWSEASDFCARICVLERSDSTSAPRDPTTPALDSAPYRLPTEAEWEYACRGGSSTNFWNSNRDEDLDSVGWHRANSANQSHACGTRQANPWGLYDVHGNVWEWVQDGWQPSYDDQVRDPVAMPSQEGLRVLRGGSFLDPASPGCRVSYRGAFPPSARSSSLGFRVALAIEHVKTVLKSK
jgi:formylglycine-generating enzyme required for sulfatase activity